MHVGTRYIVSAPLHFVPQPLGGEDSLGVRGVVDAVGVAVFEGAKNPFTNPETHVTNFYCVSRSIFSIILSFEFHHSLDSTHLTPFQIGI